MTTAERASLDILRAEVNAGFREIRDLMEVRRIEEVRVKDNLSDDNERLDARVQRVERVAWLAGLIGGAGLVVGGVLVNHFLT